MPGDDDRLDRWERSETLPPLGQGDRLVAIAYRFFLNSPKWLVFLEALVLVMLVGLLDYVTGPEYAFSIFYLVPIVFMTWFGSWRSGLVVSILSAALPAVFDLLGREEFASPLVPLWNLLARLGFFAITLALVEGGRRGIARERTLALTDALTGVANSRSFDDRLEYSLAFMRRRPIPVTVAYVDLDDFKAVNDRFGHSEGDAVLRAVASAIAGRLRRTDMVARIGGDEFGIVLPDTDAETAVTVLQDVSRAIESALHPHRALYETIGAVTFTEPPVSVDMMVSAADRLMYHGKRAGKARIEIGTWPVAAAEPEPARKPEGPE